MLAAGPALYLLGHSLFRLVMAGSVSGKRLAGAVACVPSGCSASSCRRSWSRRCSWACSSR